ncbi:hypothetical protein BG015_011188 [Linnemannia schmuckeri]|uniref:F-box domain-containing protein n=1 Tax=Linnemannia schmuckeri TaxID=64567 RepID=A0A9P5S506_9FUNG|nr:hypothetical protein BG015_011188 [Linnemannia schmuckeri]
MSSAIRFFDIPELTHMVAAHLDNRDTLMLSRTIRRLHQLCEPLLYTDLCLDYDSREVNLFDSYEAAIALARNIQHVRHLKISVIDIAMLFNCLLVSLDATKDSTSDDPQDARPNWLPSPDPTLPCVVPIPLMTNLERLDAHLGNKSYYIDSCPYYLDSCEDPQSTLLQLSWIISLNPRLTDLKVVRPIISNANDLSALSTSLSGLLRLETLVLDGVVSREEVWGRIGRTIFDNCSSSSTRTLSCSMDQYSATSRLVQEHEWSDIEQQQEQDDLQAAATPIPLVQEALQDLTMWSIGEVTSDKELISTLQCCPNIERLSLRGIQGQISGSAIGRALGVHCPKLRKLAFSDFNFYGNTNTPVQIMTAVPQQRIEEFKWSNSFERLSGLTTNQMFRQHSEVLRKLVFESCFHVASDAIRTILTMCPVLEHFQMQINSFDHVLGGFIELSDATASPWVCTKLKVLDLAVAIPDMPDLETGQDPYYMRTPSVDLSVAEQESLAMYDQLYRHIGSLTSLTHLALRAVLVDRDHHLGVHYQDGNRSFPAMLSLKNEQTGRPGYLDLLRGLTQLQELRGSVNTSDKETKVTAGWEEVRWMVQHWPALKVAAFGGSYDRLSEPFRWLQRELDLELDTKLVFRW